MVNKKGLLRIIEVSIAVVIIAGSVGMLKFDNFVVNDNIPKDLRNILVEIERNFELRKFIVESENNEIKRSLMEFIDEKNYLYFNYDVVICNLGDECLSKNIPNNFIGEIFSEEILVSSDLNSFNPKRIRIFAW